MPRPLGQDLHKERLGLRLVVLNAYVYAVKRVNSSDLLKQGQATLEGSKAYASKLAEHKQAIREIEAGLRDPRKSDEEKAEIRAQLEIEQESQRMSMAEALVGDPEKAVAFMNRCRAYACAMVVKAGRLKTEYEALMADQRGMPKLVTSAFQVSEYCEDLRTDEEIAAGDPKLFLAPFSFVMNEADADPENNIVWVHAFDNTEITALGTVLMGLQEVASSVTATFRDGSGVFEIARNDGPPVESPAVGDTEVHAGRNGD
jgi:hypothetical protein